MNKEQIKEILEEWFKDPIDVPCAYCEAAKAIAVLHQQHEPLTDEEHEIVNQEWEKAHAVEIALKEQMERVMERIDRQIYYIKFSALNFKQNDTGKACTNAILGTLENLKAELEG